jgi:hypothetical protein
MKTPSMVHHRCKFLSAAVVVVVTMYPWRRRTDRDDDDEVLILVEVPLLGGCRGWEMPIWRTSWIHSHLSLKGK